MKSPLELLEARFKGIFEGKPSIKDWMQDRPDSFQSIVNEIDAFLQEQSDGSTLPAQYIFYFGPEDATTLGSEPELEGIILSMMIALGTERGLAFMRTPSVKIVIKNSLNPGQLEIKAALVRERSDQTDSFTAHTTPSVFPMEIENPQANLLLADETIIPLAGSVTNLGRKSNNHIIFDDLRVSRNHAQIRLIFKDYVLFDTGSSGGTFVNGERISQYTLKSGDVISLAGVKLIFSREGSAADTGEREITSKLGPAKKEE
jgi:hypothetical protein